MTTNPDAIPLRRAHAGYETRQRLIAAAHLTERRLDLAGVSTAVLEGGDGPPMVLLHGQGEFWAVWMPVFDDLVRSHRLVVVDLPGHGASSLPAGRLDADTVMQWLDALIDATCPVPPVLAGHLLGGAIAARYAVEHADRLAHLVLVDSLGLGWFRPTASFAVPMVAFMARPTARSRDRLFRQCFLDFDQTGETIGESWDDLRDYALERARTPELKAALRTLMPRIGMPPIPTADLERITVPTTLIHGRSDSQVRLALAEAASARHGWPLHVIDGARDDPAAEQPAAFVAALRTALGTTGHRSDKEAS